MDPILPSEPADPRRTWGRDQLRLHRHLRRRPGLLPERSTLLLAVSGGQDSMALTQLLLDLRELHGWTLLLWHGDHGWRPEASSQAEELADWAHRRGLPLLVERADPQEPGGGNAEESARRWRYLRLEAAARNLGCRRVVTAHTASDRAETVLLNLARGSHLRGLASLRARRPLGDGSGARPGESGKGVPDLVRPLLIFDRADTARLCRERNLPVWLDPGNEDLRFSRNRVRAEVLPVLEALHPGAARRIGAQAERLSEEVDAGEELMRLALTALAEEGAAGPPGSPTGGTGAAAAAGGVPPALRRRRLTELTDAVQRRLVQHWLQHHTGRRLTAAGLESLLARLAPTRPPGRHDLAGGWQLIWDTRTLRLVARNVADGGTEGAAGSHPAL